MLSRRAESDDSYAEVAVSDFVDEESDDASLFAGFSTNDDDDDAADTERPRLSNYAAGKQGGGRWVDHKRKGRSLVKRKWWKKREEKVSTTFELPPPPTESEVEHIYSDATLEAMDRRFEERVAERMGSDKEKGGYYSRFAVHGEEDAEEAVSDEFSASELLKAPQTREEFEEALDRELEAYESAKSNFTTLFNENEVSDISGADEENVPKFQSRLGHEVPLHDDELYVGVDHELRGLRAGEEFRRALYRDFFEKFFEEPDAASDASAAADAARQGASFTPAVAEAFTFDERLERRAFLHRQRLEGKDVPAGMLAAESGDEDGAAAAQGDGRVARLKEVKGAKETIGTTATTTVEVEERYFHVADRESQNVLGVDLPANLKEVDPALFQSLSLDTASQSEITKAVKQRLTREFRRSKNDVGSTEVQVAVLTYRINLLRSHMAKHKKDHNARRGLRILMARRRHLLDYLKRTAFPRWKTLVGRLKLPLAPVGDRDYEELAKQPEPIRPTSGSKRQKKKARLPKVGAGVKVLENSFTPIPVP